MPSHQILFVDDEAMVLQGLRRMLRAMRREWDMRFAESGEEGLVRMAEDEADIVVSDMRMPGIDGAEFLAEVKQRHPQAIRIALSGQSDRDLILRAVPSTHQYLAKPCDPETLKATLRRACALRDELDNPDLQQLVTGLGSVGCAPEHYEPLSEELGLAAPSLDRVIGLAGDDPALAAKLLQLVNSPFFGNPRRIGSPGRAATLLGIETLARLGTQGEIFSPAADVVLETARRGAFWGRSRSAARCAEAIGADFGGEEVEEDAVAAALLADIGMLILLNVVPERYRPILESVSDGSELLEKEQQELGTTHAAVGAYLLGICGVPEPIVEAVAHHHQPNEHPGFGLNAVTAVHVAAAISGELAETGPWAWAPQLDKHYLSRLGVASSLDDWRAACRLVVERERAA